MLEGVDLVEVLHAEALLVALLEVFLLLLHRLCLNLLLVNLVVLLILLDQVLLVHLVELNTLRHDAHLNLFLVVSLSFLAALQVVQQGKLHWLPHHFAGAHSFCRHHFLELFI